MAKFCSNCGGELNENQDICLKCGVRVNKTNPVNNDPNAKSKLGAGLLAIFVGALGVHNFYLGYNGKGKIFKDKDEVNCGNWCNYLITNNLIHSYLWIGDKSSNKWNCDYPYHHIKHMNLFNLKADKIIICLSPEYVPEKYWPLFYIWMSTIGFLKNTNYYLN